MLVLQKNFTGVNNFIEILVSKYVIYNTPLKLFSLLIEEEKGTSPVLTSPWLLNMAFFNLYPGKFYWCA